jgi:N-acetyl-alpha-D-muramate 1-phosphate uridylyltransferase
MPVQFMPDLMLLAAGLGRRMLPFTVRTPKPLIPVLGRPALDRIIDNAEAEGATRFVINAHHLAHKLVAHVETLRVSHPGSRFLVSDESAALLDTGGGVKHALPLLESDPIFVLNTDAFWPEGSDKPLARMLQRFEEGRAEIILLCVHPFRAIGFRRSHDFCLAPDGHITMDWGAPVIYTGVALLRRSLFENTPEGPFSLNLLFDRALASETLFGVALDAPWLHVGDPEALLEAERVLA